jgi:hypothetical protein
MTRARANQREREAERLNRDRALDASDRRDEEQARERQKHAEMTDRLTKEDLENARRALQEWQERFDLYSGNNPDNYQADIRAARRRVQEIEDALKTSGKLPCSDRERMNIELDRAFSNAKSKGIAKYRGRKFQRHFYPLEHSLPPLTTTTVRRFVMAKVK